MFVSNLSFSAPNDKEQEKIITFSRFLCYNLCETNLESESSVLGMILHAQTHAHKHVHTGTHTPTLLLGSPRERPPEVRELLPSSIKLNTFLQSSFYIWTLYLLPLVSLTPSDQPPAKTKILSSPPAQEFPRRGSYDVLLGWILFLTGSYTSLIGFVFPQDKDWSPPAPEPCLFLLLFNA